MFLLLIFCCMALWAPPLWAQESVVSGMVVSEQSLQPLAGVQVVVEGQAVSSVTDASGRFRLEGLRGGTVTLQATLLGYRTVTREVAVGSRDVRLQMPESAIELDAIVVTGTAVGTQRRSIGNAITTVDAAESLEQSAAPDVSNLLNGRTPGAIITPGTGRVGSGPSINIRGRSTISLSQQPLIYIDGVRVNNDIATGPQQSGIGAVSRLNDLNPSDIESIEVIKGPAAATLYGTEAANGVIQIITKKGAVGAPRFTATVRQGASWF
ncbi:MAG TPA: TonB-dependent receptor plug domain-containing protein, partial [Longimicrobiales bacterium]|nr:TonB-dependent receptor plug domain-containing protein [Longimicrobiales bacterium]